MQETVFCSNDVCYSYSDVYANREIKKPNYFHQMKPSETARVIDKLEWEFKINLFSYSDLSDPDWQVSGGGFLGQSTLDVSSGSG